MIASVALVSTLLAATAQAANFTVVVGGTAGKVFTPNQINDAKIGDFVTFEFHAANHTVTQSTFAQPCAILQNAATGAVGFDSGFVPVAADATTFPTWTLQISNDSIPIWAYCRQATHCKDGMVMSINAPATGNTFDKFLAAAQASTPGAASNTTTPSAAVTSGTGVGVSVAATQGSTTADASASGAAAAGGNGAASTVLSSTALLGALSLAMMVLA